MILPFDVITIIISFFKPKYIYNCRLLNKTYYSYIIRKNRFDFSKITGYDLIYAVKRNKIILIEWLINNKMTHNKLLTYAVIYSKKETILYILKKVKKHRKKYINLILAKQRENEHEIYDIVINYYKHNCLLDNSIA